VPQAARGEGRGADPGAPRRRERVDVMWTAPLFAHRVSPCTTATFPAARAAVDLGRQATSRRAPRFRSARSRRAGMAQGRVLVP
jgi:hypothetical protein